MIQTALAFIDHITSVEAELHWLPIRARVTFKVATHSYRDRTIVIKERYHVELTEDYQPRR